MNNLRNRTLLTLVLSLALSGGRALADALVITEAMNSSTIAELFVEGQTMRLQLEVGLSDLPAFARLMPDEIYEKLGHEQRPFDQRLSEFFREDWILRVDGGEPLAGKLLSIKPRPRVKRDRVTGDPIPPAEGEEVEQVLEVLIDYQIPPRPATLSLSPLADPQTGITASIGFVVYHGGVAVNDFRYLGSEETLDFDWDDPWYSAFRNRNLKRTFSAPAQGFIYVEPYEIRKEILIRPMDLQSWVDLGLEGKETIAAAEHETLKAKVVEFLGKHCHMTVDGEPVEFEFDRIHFVRRSLRQTSVVTEPVDLPLVSAMLGVIYVHRRDGLPQEATLTWDLFNDKISSMRGATHDEAGPFPAMVTPDDPVLKWTNFLKNPTLPTFVKLKPPPAPATIGIPLLSSACGVVALLGLVVSIRRGKSTSKLVLGATVAALIAAAVLWPVARKEVRDPFSDPPAIADGEAVELISGLLRNVYRAFDYRDEEVVYDSLARSVAGDLLTEMYVEVYNALYLQSQGGAKVKVDQLDMLEATSENMPGSSGFTITCQWIVSGKVDHWGHVHTRRNQYEAMFSVEAVDGEWKITAQDLAGAKRIS